MTAANLDAARAAACKEKERARDRTRYAANQEKKTQYQRDYYAENRQQILERRRARRVVDGDLMRAREKDRRARNRDNRNQIDRERHSQKQSQKISDWRDIIEEQAQKTINLEWRDIPDHPGYQASVLGMIRSVDRIVINKNGIVSRYRGKILKQTKDKNGYPRLYCGNRRTTELVSTLVCMAFHGPRPSPGYEVAHWDGNPDNNSSRNLRWATRQENIDDMKRHGTISKGERNHWAKLSQKEVDKIRLLLSDKISHRRIALLFSVSRQTIDRIKSWKNWK